MTCGPPAMAMRGWSQVRRADPIAWWFGDIDFPRREAEAIMRAYPGETGRSVRCECLWKNDSADANLSPKEIDFLNYALWWR